MNWLKRKLRAWLLDDTEPSFKNDIEIYQDGGIVKVKVLGTVGDFLTCATSDGSEMLISRDQARNSDVFDRILGDTVHPDAAWDDGTPYETPNT